MYKQVDINENRLPETALSHSDIAVDKTLIKQFARRVYGDIKVWLKNDCEINEAFTALLCGGNRAEIDKFLVRHSKKFRPL